MHRPWISPSTVCLCRDGAPLRGARQVFSQPRSRDVFPCQPHCPHLLPPTRISSASLRRTTVGPLHRCCGWQTRCTLSPWSLGAPLQPVKRHGRESALNKCSMRCIPVPGQLCPCSCPSALVSCKTCVDSVVTPSACHDLPTKTPTVSFTHNRSLATLKFNHHVCRVSHKDHHNVCAVFLSSDPKQKIQKCLTIFTPRFSLPVLCSTIGPAASTPSPPPFLPSCRPGLPPPCC